MMLSSAHRVAGARRRVLAQLLVQVCRGDDLQLSAGLPATTVAAAARHHRIAPLAHVRLRDAAPVIAEPLRPDRDAAKMLHIRASALLGEVSRILGEIPWVTFKGPVLSELAHPVPGLRPYGDLDLLVAPSSLREVTRRLSAAGWTVADYDDMLRNPQTPGEMHWFTPLGIPVDLHWSMINMAARRRLFDIPTDDLLVRRTSVRIGLATVWVMDPVDAMVHTSLHAALAGGNTLGWVLDVDQLARQVTDWPAVAMRAREWGAEAQVALMLRRSSTTLGTPVPAELYRQLGASAGLRLLVDVVDRVRPVERHRTDASLSRLLARAVRPGVARTLLVVLRNTARGLVDRLRRPDEPGPERVSAGPETVEGYLDAVEMSGRGI